jgi:hypothetical protein
MHLARISAHAVTHSGVSTASQAVGVPVIVIAHMRDSSGDRRQVHIVWSLVLLSDGIVARVATAMLETL